MLHELGLALLLRRAARHEQITGEEHHGFVILIERRRLYPQQAAIRTRFGRWHFKYFARGVQFAARPDRARPTEIVETDAKNAARRLELAIDHQTHGHPCSVPAACRQSAKRRFLRSHLIEMKRLRIELLGV